MIQNSFLLNQSLAVQTALKRSSSSGRMETLEKFNSIPIVDMGLKKGLTIYNRVKSTNRLVTWGLETSENMALSVIESIRPVARIVEGPLERIDKLGLGILEKIEGRTQFTWQFVVSLYSSLFSQKKCPIFIYHPS